MSPSLDALYGHSLALATDLYQLTMAYGYWKAKVADTRAAFHLFFRKNPFEGGYALAAGLASVIELIERFRFTPDDLAYLATLRGNDGAPLFEREFLDYLGDMRFACDVDAVPEGTVVFAHEPLLRVTGPMIQGQLLETPLLNLINFATLIATKASRVCQAARGGPVLEFGLRRAQGMDGAMTASRAAYIGGSTATSNVLAGKLYGIPVRGTHAHSWVMFFADERQAFDAYARAMPNNCVFLVDTYDTLAGVRHAIEVGHELRRHGHEMAGVRLDSGDLAYLSVEARRLLDEAGFPDAAIVASNDLDEHVIESLQEQGAAIGVWGVGTKLATAYDQPALGGVYKLGAVARPDGTWQYTIKLSEQTIKISNPGILQVRRFSQAGRFLADMIHCQASSHLDESTGTAGTIPVGGPLHDISDPLRVHDIGPYDAHEDLLVPIFRAGERIYDVPALAATRSRALAQLEQLDPRVKRFLNPQTYPMGLDPVLHQRKLAMIMEARDRVAPGEERDHAALAERKEP